MHGLLLGCYLLMHVHTLLRVFFRDFFQGGFHPRGQTQCGFRGTSSGMLLGMLWGGSGETRQDALPAVAPKEAPKVLTRGIPPTSH